MSATTQDLNEMLNLAQGQVAAQAKLIEQLRAENSTLRAQVAAVIKNDAASRSAIVWLMPEVGKLRCEVDLAMAEVAKEVMHRLASDARLRAILNTFPWLVSVVPADRLLSGGGAS